MRLALVSASLGRSAGGILDSLAGFSRELAIEGGVPLCVLGLSGTVAEPDPRRWNPVPTCAFPVHGPRAFGYSPALRAGLMAGEFALVHTHGLWMYPSVAVSAWHRRTGMPYLVSPHGMLDPWALRNSSLKKRVAAVLFEYRHLREAACIHALCQSEAESIRAFGLRNPIAIIPNGVELPDRCAEFQVSSVQYSDKPKILLFLGRIHPKKGLVNALRAWAALQTTDNGQRTTDNWQFVVAGWDQGGHEAELKRLCRELGLGYADISAAEFVGETLAGHAPSGPLGTSGRAVAGTPYRPTEGPASVVFVGPAFGEQKDALLRSASAFILPSFSEGLPMAVLEAWAYRQPVLMTEHCNLPEGFAAGAAIRIGTDVASIAEGLRELCSLPTTDNGQRTTSLASMGMRGRQLVEERFTWPQVAAQMKEVYEWIVGGGTRPMCVEGS